MHQTNNNNSQAVQSEVIDLRELFSILNSRKRLISLITVIITTLAIIYAFYIAKPIYTVNALIEVGQIEAEPIDDINSIQQKLAYKYKVNGKTKRLLPYVKSIVASKKSKTILSLVVYGNSNDEASKYIHSVIHNIETQYRDKTNNYIESQKEHIALVKENIRGNMDNLKRMQNELKQYNQKIITLKHEDAALAGIYALQIGESQKMLQDLTKYISELKEKSLELKLSITSLMIKPTHIIGEIEVLDKPVKPKKMLIVIISFIMSLMLSVFLAFFLTFIQGLRKSEIEKDK